MFRILTAIGVVLILFGWWGLESPTGRVWFDEMAGIIPFGSGVVGLLFVAAAIIFRMLRRPPHG